jgi:hypothetical protein
MRQAVLCIASPIAAKIGDKKYHDFGSTHEKMISLLTNHFIVQLHHFLILFLFY